MINNNTEWRKATASGGNGGCVEMRLHGGKIQVRDSKDPDGPNLEYTGFELQCLKDGLAKGEFDDIINGAL